MRSASIVSAGDQEVCNLKTFEAGDCPTRSLPLVALHFRRTWRGMRNRMLGRFERLSGRCGAYDDIRDRFPLVAKSKVGSVGDMADGGGGEGDGRFKGSLLSREALDEFWW